jgi:hypothetical protein
VIDRREVAVRLAQHDARAVVGEVAIAAGAPAAPAVEEGPAAPLVMVVDDSLTVRKITGRMLSREGYESFQQTLTDSTDPNVVVTLKKRVAVKVGPKSSDIKTTR